jgi:glycosyltransferase EpsE
MATYNDPPYFLSQAIESILHQSYSNWELIIVDDSTSEETIAVLADFKERFPQRIRVQHNIRHEGFVPSLNRALADAQGRYIARMDGDDISTPDRLEKQVHYLGEHLEVGILGSDITIIGKDGLPYSRRIYPHTFDEIQAWALFRNPIAHPSVMITRETLSAIGVYDRCFLRAEDYELWLRALRAGIIINNIPEVLLHYRIVGSYAAKRDKANSRYVLRAKFKHFDMRNPWRCIAGMCASGLFYALPSALMNFVYARESRTRTVKHR